MDHDPLKRCCCRHWLMELYSHHSVHKGKMWVLTAQSWRWWNQTLVHSITQVTWTFPESLVSPMTFDIIWKLIIISNSFIETHCTDYFAIKGMKREADMSVSEQHMSAFKSNFGLFLADSQLQKWIHNLIILLCFSTYKDCTLFKHSSVSHYGRDA